MKKMVERERNKIYYRALHVPIWIWVFFVLPGDLTYRFYLHGPDRAHWIWLAIVSLGCAGFGFAGVLPGVEPRPYITHYGVPQRNVWYRVVCYTAAWIDLLVPYALNLLGLLIAVSSGRWMMAELYAWLYWPLALAITLATALDLTPRARRSTFNEGAERAWFYVAIWTVVPSQLAAWAMWRMGRHFALTARELAWGRLAAFLLVSGLFFFLAYSGLLGRTQRYSVKGDRELDLPGNSGRALMQ